MKRGRWRLVLVGAAAWALAAAALLLGFEIYLRLSRTHILRRNEGRLPFLVESDADFLVDYTPRGRRLVPDSRVLIKNHRISGRDVVMEVNSLGFRDEELPLPKGENETRILVLGDSITWESYLPAEETYVERLQARLGELLPDRRVEVINAGVGDIGLKEEVDILEERGRRAQPDLVMVAFYLNDSRPPWGFPGELGRRGWLRRHSLLAETIYTNFKLRRFIREQGEERLAWAEEMNDRAWMNDRERFLQLARRARFDWGAAWEPDSWEVVARELDRLKKDAEEGGFQVAVAAFPNALQVYASFLENSPQRRLEALARERGFYFLDLLPALRKFRLREKDIYFDWCHPTPKTNDLIATILSDFIFPLTLRANGKIKM